MESQFDTTPEIYLTVAHMLK